MLLRKLVVVGLVGFVSFAANIATAEEAVAPNASYGVSNISFADETDALAPSRFSLDISRGDGPRFASLAPTSPSDTPEDTRNYEVALVHRGTHLDVSFAQRGGLGVDENGEITTKSSGSELRLGRDLSSRRNLRSATPSWYFFAASDDEALTWRPGGRNDFGGSRGGLSLQDQVEVGDMSAGVTYEVFGIQASLAYVEREVSVHMANRSFSNQDNFAGVTLTMRH